jgi:hypothetical protein
MSTGVESNKASVESIRQPTSTMKVALEMETFEEMEHNFYGI